LNFFPKENLFLLNVSSDMQSFEMFGALNVAFSYFTNLDEFEYWRNFEILKKRVHRVLGPAHCNSSGPAPA
jgi:hypothetical protein